MDFFVGWLLLLFSLMISCRSTSQTHLKYRERRNVDECALDIDECGVNQYCVDTPDSYLCFCLPGFVFDGQMCVNVDECAVGPASCDPNSDCVDTVGSFDCICRAGYSGDGRISCTDIDECEMPENVCDVNADCNNTAGSYNCVCKAGYSGNGTSCLNVDECEVGSASCDPNSDCVDTDGSYDCICRAGYTGDGTTSCMDIDECELPENVCDVNADCTNTAGSYNCVCKAGYSGNGTSCLNVNECTDGSASCDLNSDCVDTPGSYDCVCRHGYTGDGRISCTDINECETAESVCDVNAECNNTAGSYVCVCRAGYSGNGESCLNVNECTDGSAPCDSNSDCVDTPGSYDCICRPGYTGDGRFFCTDIDECETPENVCDVNADCTNTAGSYNCVCKAGYSGNGAFCQRDCSEDCDVNADCIGDRCVCRPGYFGDGNSCLRILNCLDICDANAECFQVDGSVKCVCRRGYSGNGFTCNSTMSVAGDSANYGLTLGPVLGSLGLLGVLLLVASLFTIIYCKHKRLQRRRLLMNTRGNRRSHTSMKSLECGSQLTGTRSSNPEYIEIPNTLRPGEAISNPPYDFLQEYARYSYPAKGPATESSGLPYDTLEAAASYDILGNATLTSYHVLDYGGKEDTAMYCVPASEELRLYSQITSYGVKDVPNTDITLIESVGSGQFGRVSKGLWTCEKGVKEVAVKTLTDSANTVKFLQEAAIMAQFKHPNVVFLHGIVSTATPKMIIVELMHNGDLEAHLEDMQPDPGEMVPGDLPHHLLEFCIQIAIGMNYLATKGFVHRDLAARNVLVSKHNICKIADFGMSRDLLDDDYYVAHVGKIPIKWCAPEVLNYRKYSTASDVWSYGCVLYEIWSLGHKPFEDATNSEALQLITSGKCLPPPPGCPKSLYTLMVQCWTMTASERPDYKTMLKVLTSNKETVLAVVHDEVTEGSSQATVLGAPLEAGQFLYKSLQQQ